MNNNSTFAYVHTESGPVKPAKAVPIQTMKNIIASIQGKHVRGEKGTNWGDLAKKVNKDCNPHGYTTIQTILNKALTEAAAQAVGQSVFRLDLGNVVCDSAHAKFKISRRNHSVIVDMLYPNDNGNITIRYNVDDVAAKMFELSLDSEHYVNGFGHTILKCCDDAIKEAEEMAEEDDIYSTDENGYQPIMSADMRGLLKMTNAIMESDFGEADFAAPAPDAGGGMDAGMGGGMDAGMGGGAGGGAANLGGNLETDDAPVKNFVEDIKEKLNTDVNRSLSKILTIVSDKKAERGKENASGEPLTAKQIRDGIPPLNLRENTDAILQDFKGFYEAFDETQPNPITKKELGAIVEFLDNNDVNSAMDFEAWLYSNPMMRDLYKRNNIGLQGTTTKDNGDVLDLPKDGTEAANGAPAAGGGAGGGFDMAAPSGGGFGMAAPAPASGGFDMGAPAGGGFDMAAPAPDAGGMGTDANAQPAGDGIDINAIGDVDQISENTSTELPNLGGEQPAEQPVDETAPQV